MQIGRDFPSHSTIQISQWCEHVVSVIVYSEAGATLERTALFETVRFENNFIADENAVDLDAASCRLENNEITVSNGAIDGSLLDFILKWRPAEQGFEIIEIR